MRLPSVAAFLFAFASSLQGPMGPLSLFPPSAHALTAIEMSFEQLVGGSELVIVGTARESQSVWEDSEGARGRRIVTYTRVQVDQVVDGTLPSEPIWVRTLGGTVGDIGQRVEGETVLSFSEPSLLFLRRRADATHSIVGMSQGQFPLEASSATANAGARRVLSSRHLDGLVPRIGHSLGDPAAARVMLAGKTVEDVSALIRAERKKHAK